MNLAREADAVDCRLSCVMDHDGPFLSRSELCNGVRESMRSCYEKTIYLGHRVHVARAGHWLQWARLRLIALLVVCYKSIKVTCGGYDNEMNSEPDNLLVLH